MIELILDFKVQKFTGISVKLCGQGDIEIMVQ